MTLVTAAPASADSGGAKIMSGVCGTYGVQHLSRRRGLQRCERPVAQPDSAAARAPEAGPDFVPVVAQALICYVAVKYVMRKVPGTDGAERWVRTQLLRSVCRARPA